jgi:hypothetical protein
LKTENHKSIHFIQISYVALFGNFFYQSYVRGGGKKYNKEKKSPANGQATTNGGLKAE